MQCNTVIDGQSAVALRKESVDRNGLSYFYIIKITRSLSVRRAWIEIESKQIDPSVMQSLSVRRAWIEILHYGVSFGCMKGRSP